ncbi:AAA family ATPase [Candidatus Pacearchaeota archaeon]|nr:AAA family ATPase [Candidatus Pacearchaeota archaeon]
MKSKKRFVIGITGPSGSGKTTISEILTKRLKAGLMHSDDYWKYHGRKIPSRKEWKKWEHPSSIDFKRLERDIVKLKNKIIIVKGFHMLYNKKIRDILDLKIYADIPKSLIVKRRLDRFGHEDNQEWYSKNIVVKSYKKYGEPTKKHADLHIMGTENINKNVKKILDYIKNAN